ncbi:very late factor 1b-2, bracovirus particle protein [Microplitis demolitor]|uniref:very late factor 1b-2, bracovirus particle protein n=1 Tax=Microplitis demolitor TaxID=69319 RepID=UPI00044001EC|nr:very late factor 1b-2, bracovirus particle protein [Microplitis demolitor]KAG6558535.1 very late factor 1b-2, bracovirus particle protein [Microplitis demolitor]
MSVLSSIDNSSLQTSRIETQLPLIHNNQCLLRQYREMTIETQKIHKAKLAKLKIEISQLNNSNIEEYLNKIKMDGRSSKELSNSYVNAIYSTVKLLNPSLTKTASEMKYLRRSRRVPVEEYLDTVLGVKQLIEKIKQYTESFINIDERKIESRRKIDTIIAITVTMLTNLRTTELLQLEIKHLYQIAQKKPITLKLSYNKEQRIDILLTETISSSMYKNIINMVLSREIWCDNSFNNTSQIKQSCIKLISCKNDTINKTFSEFYVQINSKKPKLTLGLKTIRSCNSTRLVQHIDGSRSHTMDESIFDLNLNEYIKLNKYSILNGIAYSNL